MFEKYFSGGNYQDRQRLTKCRRCREREGLRWFSGSQLTQNSPLLSALRLLKLRRRNMGLPFSSQCKKLDLEDKDNSFPDSSYKE